MNFKHFYEDESPRLTLIGTKERVSWNKAADFLKTYFEDNGFNVDMTVDAQEPKEDSDKYGITYSNGVYSIEMTLSKEDWKSKRLEVQASLETIYGENNPMEYSVSIYENNKLVPGSKVTSEEHADETHWYEEISDAIKKADDYVGV